MQRFLYTILLLFACFFLHAQPNADLTLQPENNISVTEKTIYHKLGVNIVPINIQQYGEYNDIVFVNPHDDEFTSVTAAIKVIEEKGGLLIEIENNLKRNPRFQLGDYLYQVDQNKIFSKEGIKKSLERFGKSSFKAMAEAFFWTANYLVDPRGS